MKLNKDWPEDDVDCMTPGGVYNLLVILEVTWQSGLSTWMPLQQLSRHENNCWYSTRLVYKDCTTGSSLAGDYHGIVCNREAGKISGCCIRVCKGCHITQGCTTEAAEALEPHGNMRQVITAAIHFKETNELP